MLQEKINRVVKILEHVKTRPGMYVGLENSGIVHFLVGFKYGCDLAELPNINNEQVYKDVVIEHGWEVSSKSVWTQMREQGIDEAGALDEILTIEIEAWKKIMQSPDE